MLAGLSRRAALILNERVSKEEGQEHHVNKTYKETYWRGSAWTSSPRSTAPARISSDWVASQLNCPINAC